MNRPINALVAAIAAATALSACASTRPAAPAPVSPVAATAAPSPVAAAGSTKVVAAQAGYRTRTRQGEEVYCKRELITGSRTKSTETCLTAAQVEKQRNGVNALLRSVQDMNSPPARDAFNNVMTSAGRSGGQ